jgi:hypothetical protein
MAKNSRGSDEGRLTMEIRSGEMKALAKRMLLSGRDQPEPVTESQVETLKAYLQQIGEYEDGMDLEEGACIVLLYEIQKEKAQRIPSEGHSPLSFSRAL